MSGATGALVKLLTFFVLAYFLWPNYKMLVILCFLTLLLAGIPVFPGCMLHEWSHKKMCEIRGLKVVECNYFLLGGVAGSTTHENSGTAMDEFMIGMAPFIFMPPIALGLFILANLSDEPVIKFIVLWLATTISMCCLPSLHDTMGFWTKKKEELYLSVFMPISKPNISVGPAKVVAAISMTLGIGGLLWLEAFVTVALMWIAQAIL